MNPSFKKTDKKAEAHVVKNKIQKHNHSRIMLFQVWRLTAMMMWTMRFIELEIHTATPKSV